MSPVIRTLLFTVFVPGFWTVMMPCWLLPRGARAGFARSGRHRLAADCRRNRTLLCMCFLGIRNSRQRHAASIGSAKETGGRGTLPDCAKSHVLECWLCDARRGGCLSLVRTRGVGGGIRRGCECVCPTLRGAYTAAEIRGEIRRVLQECAEVVPAVPSKVVAARPYWTSFA